MNDTLKGKQDWRYERKFLVENYDCRLLERIVLGNRGFFRRLYSERQINNFYFDTDDYFCFVQNIDGQAQRRKYRVRWYGDTFGHLNNPVLEVKIKEALVGCKRRFSLQPLDFSETFDWRVVAGCLASSELPATVYESLSTMRPVLLNSYTRRYFISGDGRYRLTLDYDLSHYKLAAGKNTIYSRRSTNNLIVEIKYGVDGDNDIEFISNDFPFRMTKSSKYVQGISATLLNI